MDLRNLRKLNSEIIARYEKWVDDAPDDYIDDGFFKQRHPICITSRYGQNREMEMDDEHLEEEAANWYRERDFSKVRYFTCAIASHLQLRFQIFNIHLK
jgi:hypothetical protein